MSLVRTAFLATALLSTSATLVKADVKVVASIKPVHSLVSGVMGDLGAPDLLVEGAGSPHTYSLKPSQAKKLQDADLVFWMSHDLEAFLENAIEKIATNATSVSLMESHGLLTLNFREGGAFDAHDHGDHDEHEHDEHGHDEHGHDEHGHDEHGHDETDPHVWLDPVNAKAMVHEIEEALAAADPANSAAYEANAKALMSELDGLVAEITTELEPVRGRGYVVFHDAYQYFEKRFGVSAVGSLTISPEVLPGAERVSELQAKVRSLEATCVFSEPQFQPKLVKTITENTNAGTGVLDPLGAAIDDGPDLYFTLIRNMAKSLKDCLQTSG